ncbi:MAG: GAF domain-containing sensor histidine kinase [Anaerolineales bacterium]|nr:GAF domain-containing sensor histidine kinase [Anaerolineales bacterium]
MSPKPPATVPLNAPVLLQRLERLMEITQGLASTLDHGRLLRKIVEAACELTDSEAGSIMLLDPASGELRFEATSNLRAGQMDDVAVPLHNSVAGWVVTNNKTLVVPNTALDPRWNPTVDGVTAFVTRSILAVPLSARTQTLGVLEALNKRTGTYNDDDLTMLQWLAAQAAVAIANARLFQQSDLVAEMVHELRTPLAALTATSHLLLRPEMTEAQRREMVVTIQRETGRLAQLTTDFLDMARLESGRVRFVYSQFALGDLLAECQQIVAPQAAERGITTMLEAAADLPLLEGDRDKLKQVILNLLTNAVKYNRANGEVVLRAEAAGHLFRVYVDDTGPGIPREVQGRLFDRFYRAPGTEDTAPGTGLGLTIAKRIVEALGGEIGVQSTLGRGSTFYFFVPAAPRSTGPLAG